MTVPREGESMYGPRARPDYEIDADTGCWEWLKSKSKLGYPNGRQYRRYYELAHGAIPDGYHVHHKCRNRGCVNPDHLEAVDPREHHIEHFLRGRGGITFDLIKAIRAEGRKPHTSLLKTAETFGVGPATVQAYWADDRWMDILDDGPVGRPGITCALEECDVVFVPARRDGKFCCATHRTRHNNRKPEQVAKRTQAQRERRRRLAHWLGSLPNEGENA